MNETKLKISLQQITSDQNMDVLRYVANLMIKNWQSPSVIGATEWETVKNAIVREERGRALNLFLEEIEKMAHE